MWRLKYSKAVYTAIGIVATAGEAIAQQPKTPTTAEWLYERCVSPDSAVQDSCAAFLLGSASVLAMLGKAYQYPPQGLNKDFAAPFGEVGICDASGNGGVLKRVFVDWAEKHPAERGIGLAQGVATAFREAWPCNQSS